MAGDTLTTFDGMLKQYYDGNKVQNLIYNDNAFLTMVDKNEGFVGNAYKVPVIWAGAQGIGHTFSTAQTQSDATANKIAGFLVTTRASMYGFTNFTRELLLASATDVGAFMSEAKVSVEGVIRGLGNQIATSLYRSGYGDQGNISGTGFAAGGTTITLTNPDDIVNFEYGQRIVVSATQSGALSALGSSGLGLLVTGVNRSTGVLTFANALNDATNGIPTIAVGDYLFVQGNHTTAATREMPYGIEAWIPATAPAALDSFWSVDRSVDSRLSGQRIDGTDGRPVEELLIEAGQLVKREGGKISHFFMSPTTYAKVLKQMQGRLLLTDVTTDSGIGFRGCSVQTPTGEALVIPDRTCPSNRIFGVQLDTWELATLGKMVAPVEEDGVMLLRKASSDAFEARYAFYGQLVCRAPGFNVNIQVPAT